jgi:hypothetical protein
MKQIQTFIDEGFAEIASKLPKLVEENPASFECGYQVGYKGCLLALDRLLEEDEE